MTTRVVLVVLIVLFVSVMRGPLIVVSVVTVRSVNLVVDAIIASIAHTVWLATIVLTALAVKTVGI